MKTCILALAFQVAFLASSHGLVINLIVDPGIDAGALSGFQRAANYWESMLTDSVQVNIEVGFQALAPGVLGQANSTTAGFFVSDVFGALIFDASSVYDATSVGNLPALSLAGGLSFVTQTNTEGGSLLTAVDNDDSGNNRVLDISTANAKALGAVFAPDAVDASITFSSLFSWDFDSSDGVDAGLQDFVGVAIHEIGHSLGFTSGVDTVDFAIDTSADLEIFRVFSILDMFRYSAPGVMNLAVGGNPYFSIDGGVTSLGAFSTGASNGDGRQASHWKDNLGLGIMDPTANPAGQPNFPNALDLIAFDVIGWNLVPEPSSALLAVVGGLFLLRRHRVD